MENTRLKKKLNFVRCVFLINNSLEMTLLLIMETTNRLKQLLAHLLP